MAYVKKRFSPQETKFIQASVQGLPPIEAARKAGYSQPGAQAYQALARPDVLEAIRREQASRLVQEGLPVAINTLITIAKDEKQPANARIAASKIIVDRGLGSEDPAAGKSPDQMTAEELQRAIEQLNAKMHAVAERARPVLEGQAAPEVPESVLD